ncbi:hypothetical protein DFH06DRAFT_918405, partial [Mycena polygramma]
KQQWLQGFLLRIGNDMKHNRNWRCTFCTKPARENVWMCTSWVHLTPPKLNCYVHNICDAGEGPCAEQMRQINVEMARKTGQPPNKLPHELPRTQAQYPMTSSCAVCHNEADASRRTLKQCAKCELTRYCSTDCQRADWKRHKECCKVVKEVKWYWN